MEFLTEHPAATLEEIKEEAVRRFPDLDTVSISTISKALNDHAHIRLKRLTVEHVRHNSDATKDERKRFMAELQAKGRALADGLFFDEAGFNLHTTCAVGQSREGDRAVQPNRPANRERNLTLEIAVDRTGVVRSDVVVGPFNTERFVRFLREDVLTAPGVRGRSRLFVMDNVSFHRSAEVRTMIEAAGHRLHRLPPYSPWLNLAEYIFSKVKPLVSRQDLRNRNGLMNVILTKVSEVTAADCEGFLQELGRHAALAALGEPLGKQHHATDTLRIRAVD